MNTLDMSQYLDVFLDEGREQLSLLESNILQMERGDHSAETLQVIFRAAHTLKGSSRAMGFLAVGDLTHEMENVLDDLRQDKLAVGTLIVNALLDCLDSLTALIDSVVKNGTDTQAEGTDIPALVARLGALRSGQDTGPEWKKEGQEEEGRGDPAPTSAMDTPVGAGSPRPSNMPSDMPSDTRPAEVPLPITDYEQASLQDAKAAGLSLFHIRVLLNADCLMKSVRVFMVLGALEPLGSVLVADPKDEVLEAEEFGQTFQLLFACDKPQSSIEQALGMISEIDAVTVAPWDTAAPAPVAEPVADAVEAEAPVAEAEAKEEGASLAPLHQKSSLVGAQSLRPSSSRPSNTPSPRPLPSAPEPAKAKTASAPSAPPAAHTQTIRVDVARLDKLLNLIGELVIDRTQIARIGSDLQGHYPHEERVAHLVEATHRIARITGELQDEIMKTRMLPIDGVFQRMPRMVRDLAQKTGKDLDFQMSGGNTELDRSVLETLGDPLIHLLRNSVDHGIESPEDRLAVGKPAQGKVTLSARHEENHIVIEIIDDGGGIDPVKIKAAAVSKGLLTPAQADAMSDRDAVHLIFAAGFSTAKMVSDISGRGVGMDIVKSNLEKLGGRVLVDSQVGQGSRFTIHLPLTLAIVRALLVSAGGGTYVLPLSSVVEMLRLGTGEGEVVRRSVGGQAMIVLRGRTMPLANLSDILCGGPEATAVERVAEDAYVVVIGWAEKQVGLCVDGLIGEQEVVIKSLGTLLGDIRGLAGATILGDGRVGLIVDPAKAIECLSEIEGATV